MSAWDRFWSKVEVGDCWRWTASTANGGYGQFFPGDGKHWRAHRWLWTQLIGPIPEGLEADHLCRNPPCVNPDHIRIVTKAENLAARPTISVSRGKKTHCKQGHEFTPENTYITSAGYQSCRKCAALRMAAKYEPGTGGTGRGQAWRATQESCVNGHPFDEENTYMFRGKRSCRACNRERSKARREKNRAAKGEQK